MTASKKFNPIKEDNGSLASMRIVWTTESIVIAKNAIEKGKRLIATPFYENDTKKLRANLVYERTVEEIEEWCKCRDDILYFVNKYAKLMTPEGIQHIILRDYQEEYLKFLQKNRLTIMLSCRQAGKTTTSSLELLHYILFNIDKTCSILGDRGRTAIEILTKAKKVFLELPYFLKPGVEKWNEHEIVLDNGCRVVVDATTPNPNLGDTLHWVLLDEFAHVHPNIVDKFYNQLFPTLVAAKAKLRITSTQNGHNLFYQLYKGAVEESNDYKPFKVDWYQVPEWNPDTRQWEKRDEKWYNSMVANLGSEEKFNKQFGTQFITTSNLLISKKKLIELQEKSIQFINKDMPGVVLSDSWYWQPDLDIHELQNKFLVITCDLAEQLGHDFTVYTIYEMSKNENLNCIGFFRNNTASRELCALTMVQFQTILCNQQNILISFERNTYGDVWLKEIQQQSEIYTTWDPACLVKYYNESGTQWKYGTKITSGNKLPHCLLLKEDLELNKINNYSSLFILELENFCELRQGVYGAQYGHDDLMMATVQLTYVKETLQYKVFRDDLELYDEDENKKYYNPYVTENNQTYLTENNQTPNELITRLNKYSGNVKTA